MQAGDAARRAFDYGDEDRRNAIEQHERRGDDYGEAIGFIDGEILRYDFADHDVAEGHQDEGEHETDGAQDDRCSGSEDGMEERHEEREECVFAGPAEAEAGERHADLGDGKKFFGLREEGESHAGSGVSFFGEMAEARIAHGEQRYFRCREEGVDHEDQAEQQEAREVVGGRGHSVTKCKECCGGEFGRSKNRTHLWGDGGRVSRFCRTNPARAG